jgi:hypothetical protein
MSELNALRNMPIWIQRCTTRLLYIGRIEGATADYQQLCHLVDYMKEVTK